MEWGSFATMKWTFETHSIAAIYLGFWHSRIVILVMSLVFLELFNLYTSFYRKQDLVWHSSFNIKTKMQ